jgi:ATP-dependent Clp protease ATP-binding subunit ClpA
MQLADEEARGLGAELIAPEHLLLALTRSVGPAARALSSQGVDYNTLLAAVVQLPPPDHAEVPPGQRTNPDARRLLMRAIELAWGPEGSCPTAVHLLLAILEEKESRAAASLAIMSKDSESLRQALGNEVG